MAAPISHFPAIAPVPPKETYPAMIDAVRTEYGGHLARYEDEANKIPGLAAAWGERTAHILAGIVEPKPSPEEREAELNRQVDRYIQLRSVRAGIIKIGKVYDQAFPKCAPPELDVSTLTCLLRMKINIPEVKQIYDQLFGTGRALLQDQRSKIRVLENKIIPDLAKLGAAVELSAFYVQGYTNAAQSIVAYNAKKALMNSSAPLVKELVLAREKAIAELVAPLEPAPFPEPEPLPIVEVAASQFPVVPAIDAKECFQAIIDGTRAQYNARYADCETQADSIPELVRNWKDRTDLVLGGTADPMPSHDEQRFELDGYVDRYNALRKVRAEILKIRDAYDQAIIICAPPVLDEETLAELQKMKVDISAIKTTYDRLFTTELTQLKEQRSRIDALALKIIPALENLKMAAENYAFHVAGYTNTITSLAAYQGLKVYMGSKSAPLLKGLVVDREKAALAVRQE